MSDGGAIATYDASTSSSKCLRAARASPSTLRMRTISGSVLASMAALPPSYSCLRTATSSSLVPSISSFAAPRESCHSALLYGRIIVAEMLCCKSVKESVRTRCRGFCRREQSRITPARVTASPSRDIRASARHWAWASRPRRAPARVPSATNLNSGHAALHVHQRAL